MKAVNQVTGRASGNLSGHRQSEGQNKSRRSERRAVNPDLSLSWEVRHALPGGGVLREFLIFEEL